MKVGFIEQFFILIGLLLKRASLSDSIKLIIKILKAHHSIFDSQRTSHVIIFLLFAFGRQKFEKNNSE
jgi:hypothetical protein